MSNEPNNIKKTALYETHLKHGARMVNFAGWYMPVQYESIIKEHEAVRSFAGIFDLACDFLKIFRSQGR